MGQVFVLGGAQTDFAVNWSRGGQGAFEMMNAAIDGALESTQLDAAQVGVAHVGNFAGELFAGQGHLGGFVASGRPEFDGLPTGRHEAACASGSVAALAAAADIESGRYDLALVVGVEQMRNVAGQDAAEHLGAAAWAGREGQDATYLWPYMFSRLAQEYEQRYGLEYAHLMAVSEQAFANARKNPQAQTRRWAFTDASFTDDGTANPRVEGLMRRQDCGQITDGAAGVLRLRVLRQTLGILAGATTRGDGPHPRLGTPHIHDAVRGEARADPRSALHVPPLARHPRGRVACPASTMLTAWRSTTASRSRST